MKIPQKSSTMSNVATCAPRQHVTRRAKKRLQRALHHGKCPAAPCLLQGKSSRYWEEREDLFQILRPVLCTQALHGVVKPQDPLILERMLHAQLRRYRHHVCLVLVRHVPRSTPLARAPQGPRPPLPRPAAAHLLLETPGAAVLLAPLLAPPGCSLLRPPPNCCGAAPWRVPVFSLV